jgi:outer membrane protein OmpU
MRENMKKVLFATTALVLTAGTAMAEVKFSGTARVGLSYSEDRFGGDGNDTIVNMRLRFNIDASKETDAGVTFGGRIRIQYDAGRINDLDADGGDLFDRSGATLNAAYVYAEANGFHVEVGNVNTAFDSLNLLYNAELGYIGETFGSYAQASYAAYETNPYETPFTNRMGVFASYAVGDLVARVSYITPDQTGLTDPAEDEFSVSVDYKVGQFSLGAGFAQNGAGIDDNDVWALTGEYAVNDSTNVGLHYVDNGIADSATVTIYGNTKLASGIGIAGYIATNDDDANTEDVALGIGASYDLGGATLAGHVAKGFFGESQASLGVNFSF